MTQRTVSCAVAAGNALGEGILWNPRDESLYWTDITAARLWRHVPATGQTHTWTMPEPLACLAPCEDASWLLLGLASRLAFFHLATGNIEPICEVEPGLPTRINDGTCDRDGRFLFGTKHEPLDGQPARPVGSFYRLDPDLALHRLDLGGVAIANGLALSPDGRTLYYCDSATRVIRRCQYTRGGGARAARDWVHLTEGAGDPDGATVDAEGALWSAHWGAGRVVRYLATGTIDTVVELPVRRPTRPALGGPGMDTLFVTSAREGAGDDAGARCPGDGHVFAIGVATPGLREAGFAGRPAAIRGGAE